MTALMPDDTSVTTVAQVIQLAVAPVFLLSGICAFLDACMTRVSRVLERCRAIEPQLLQSDGTDHRRWLNEIKDLDRRVQLMSWTIILSALSAVLTCLVVALLFAATLFDPSFGRAIALLFIGSMLTIGIGFAIFLAETRLAARSIRVRPELLAHAPIINRASSSDLPSGPPARHSTLG
jgi:ABC-type sugar transport system permease subunit